jgi:hypothetical protein
LDLAGAGQYLNRAVGMRGHLHYWNDREVLDVIQQELGVQIQVAEAPIRRAA